MTSKTRMAVLMLAPLIYLLFLKLKERDVCLLGNLISGE